MLRRRCLGPYSHGSRRSGCGSLGRRGAQCESERWAGYIRGVFFLLGPGLATLLSPPFLLPKVRAERERVWIFFAGGEGTFSDSVRYRLGWRVVGHGSAMGRGRGYLAGGGGDCSSSWRGRLGLLYVGELNPMCLLWLNRRSGAASTTASLVRARRRVVEASPSSAC